jgi:hypothetical protein
MITPPTVVLDPCLFFFPLGSEDEESLMDHIAALVAWHRHSASGPLRIVTCTETVDSLWDDELYPDQTVTKCLCSAGLEHVYSPTDLRRQVTDLLARTEDLQDILPSWPDAYFGDPVTQPDPATLHDSKHTREHREQLIALLALNQGWCDTAKKFIRFGLLPGFDTPVSVQASVNEVEGKQSPPTPLPWQMNQKIRSVEDPEQAMESLDGHDLWNEAENARDIRFAIEVAATEKRSDPETPLKRFLVGSEFLASLERHQGFNRFASPTLNTCAQLVAQTEQLAANQYLHTDDTKTTIRTRDRDGALARRVHVSKGHQAMRLLLWELEDKTLEFANIGPKFERMIEEGSELP